MVKQNPKCKQNPPIPYYTYIKSGVFSLFQQNHLDLGLTQSYKYKVFLP